MIEPMPSDLGQLPRKDDSRLAAQRRHYGARDMAQRDGQRLAGPGPKAGLTAADPPGFQQNRRRDGPSSAGQGLALDPAFKGPDRKGPVAGWGYEVRIRAALEAWVIPQKGPAAENVGV